MLKDLYREFKPTIWFIGKFILLYVVLNLLYGAYVEAYRPLPDPATVWVTHQSSFLLGLFGEPAATLRPEGRSTVTILRQGEAIVSVYEGCNGLNVFIVFVSFIFAFSKPGAKMAWFTALGLLVIHLFNLARIMLLYWVTIHLPNLMYFTHKYFFTAIIYIAVFLLWYVWIYHLDKKTVR